LNILKSNCEHHSSLHLCDEQNQSLYSNTPKLWAFCPALLLVWGKRHFSITELVPITLKPMNSWKIFSVHKKVGLQKEHKLQRWSEIAIVQSLCRSYRASERQSLTDKDTAAAAALLRRRAHLHCSLACTSDIVGPHVWTTLSRISLFQTHLWSQLAPLGSQ